jgi:hypothetical protein
MLFPEFARSPRRLLALYLTGAIGAVACLAWLGWRLLDQEKPVETQRAIDRLVPTKAAAPIAPKK